MRALKALIFDVDGTLADTERNGHRVAFNQAFEEFGIDWHWSVELYGRLLAVTGGKERMHHYIATENPSVPECDDLEELIRDLHACKTRHYTENLAGGAIPLRPGVLRLLTEARQQGMRMSIATTTTPANVEALLKSTLGNDGMDWFEVIAAGDIVPAKKPAPDIYTWAMQQMNLQPGDCMAFEDSENGVISARDAGIRNILVTTNDYTLEHDFLPASIVLDGLGEPHAPCHPIEGGVLDDMQYVHLAWLHELHTLVHAD